jgi:hypothetical protein
MNLEFSLQIFEKSKNTKFHENPSTGSRILACGRTDETKVKSLFAGLRTRSKNKSTSFTQQAFQIFRSLISPTLQQKWLLVLLNLRFPSTRASLSNSGPNPKINSGVLSTRSPELAMHIRGVKIYIQSMPHTKYIVTVLSQPCYLCNK